MKNLFIYSRISTKENKKNFQISKCLKYVKENNLQFDRIHKIREINAIGIQKVPNMKAGDIFVTFEASRISRTKEGLNKFLNMCSKRGVQVYSVKEGELRESKSSIIAAGMEVIR